jgi:hypothetical protein
MMLHVGSVAHARLSEPKGNSGLRASHKEAHDRHLRVQARSGLSVQLWDFAFKNMHEHRAPAAPRASIALVRWI